MAKKVKEKEKKKKLAYSSSRPDVWFTAQFRKNHLFKEELPDIRKKGATIAGKRNTERKREDRQPVFTSTVIWVGIPSEYSRLAKTEVYNRQDEFDAKPGRTETFKTKGKYILLSKAGKKMKQVKKAFKFGVIKEKDKDPWIMNHFHS